MRGFKVCLKNEKTPSPQNGQKRILAYTIIEILIILISIGVIVSIIPILLKNKQEKEFKAAAANVQNNLNKAFNLMIAQDGLPGKWEFSNGEAFYHLSHYLNPVKICNTEQGCWKNAGIKDLHGRDHNLDTDNTYYKAIFMDGTNFAFKSLDRSRQEYWIGKHSVYGEFLADINGKKGPNQANRDVIGFWITDTGFVVMKSDELTEDPLTECLKNKTNPGKLVCCSDNECCRRAVGLNYYNEKLQTCSNTPGNTEESSVLDNKNEDNPLY